MTDEKLREIADQTQEVVAALYKAWPDAEDIASDWPLGIIGSIEQIIRERDEALEANDRLQGAHREVERLSARNQELFERPPIWRCFHCEFETANAHEAELHFGPRSIYDPMCKMTDAGQRREYIRLDAAYSEVCAKKIASEARVLVLEGALKEAADLFVCLAQIIDVVKSEWAAANSWSDWDQQQRDRISAFLRSALSPEPIPPNNSTDEVTE